MSFFATLRAPDRSLIPGGRSGEGPTPLPATDVGTEALLPRHLLVSLAGITGDVTSLQQRCVDAPDLQAALERVLGKLDGLVDSIYQRAADPVAPDGLRSSPVAQAATGALTAAPAELGAASPGTRSSDGGRPPIPQPLAGRQS